MKTLKIFIIALVVFSTSSVLAQDQAQKETLYQDIFTSQERDSLQVWFYDRATVMGLEGDKRDEFYNIVVYHTFKMKNLNKPEKKLSSEEIRNKVKKLWEKQNLEIGLLRIC